MLLQGMLKTAEETALKSPPDIDTRSFLWTFDSLDEDHELERFFSGLPGFRSSKVVDDPLPRLTWEQKEKLSAALTGLFDRPFSSDLLPESVKNWRAIICARALDPEFFPAEYHQVMRSIMFENKCMGLQTSKFGCIVRGWGNGENQGTGLIAQAIVTSIVAGVERRDDSWFILASSALGVPESVLRDYAANSLSLAIFIHVVRQQFDHFREPFWPRFWFWTVLNTASKFDVQDTLPELQHEFCSLWNQIVFKAQNDDRRMTWILKPIRHIYVSLHQDTDSAPTQFSTSTDNLDAILAEPSSYPVCNVAGHIHDNSAPTTFAPTILDDNAAPVPFISSPDPPSLSVSSPLRLIESPAGVRPLDNFHPVHQKAVESLRASATSPDAATAGTVRDTVTSGTAMPQSSLESSISAPRLSSPSAAVAFRQNTESLTPSDPPNLSSPASSNQVLSMLPTESCHPIIATAAPTASPRPTSAPDLGAAADDDGSRKPGLRKDKDAVDPPSVNRAIHGYTMSTPYPPPQSPSQPSVTDSDLVITGRSPRGPLAIPERTGDHPPHPSQPDHRYDIV